MVDSKPLAGLALCGLLLAACASHDDEGPVHHAGGGHHAQGYAPTPVIAADVFLFLPYDADHDHRLTKAELAAAISGSWHELAGGRSSIRMLELQDWFGKVEGAAAPPFDPLEFSAQGSDSITRDQFAEGLTRRFNALDKNKDGVLDPSEMMVIPRAMRLNEEGSGPEGGMMHRRRGGGDGGPGGGY